MAENSKIEWCHHTANLWIGCTHVHEGCDNCYAEALAKRWGNDLWGNDKPRKIVKSVWDDLKRYQKQAAKENTINRVFVGSLMDIAEKEMPLIDSKGEKLDNHTAMIRYRFFKEVVPASPNLMFLLLSKRPSNYNKIIPDSWKENPPTNVMFGTSVVNQGTFNILVPQLQQVNGKRFLSVEPQLDLIKLGNLTGIDWIIEGGESGHHKRYFNLQWARSMRDECLSLGIPYFFKQVDKIQPIPDDLQIREFPTFFQNPYANS